MRDATGDVNIIPLIIDRRVQYGGGSTEGTSLLSLPLGTGSLLRHLAARVEEVAHGEILVLTDRPMDDGELSAAVGPRGFPVRAVQPGAVSRELERFEASDYLLIVDPQSWPAGGWDFSDCHRRLRAFRGAMHLISVGSGAKAARERVECDAGGHVRRVQRLYTAKSWAEVGQGTITHSIVPVRVAIDLQFGAPAQLRRSLWARGILSQDVPLARDVVSLNTEQGFLALSERMAVDACDGPTQEGYTLRSPGVLVGDNCRMHRRTRVVPPVVVQPGAFIEEGVTLVGPAVIGSGARIMQGASVIHAVVAHDVTVAADASVRQRVVSGEHTAGEVEPTSPRDVAFDSVAIGGMRPVDDDDRLSSDGVQAKRWHLVVKRAMDIALSAAALTTLAPLFALVALLIKLDSRGPVFFAHHREGRRGRDFPCWKFRTMVADAHKMQRLLLRKNEVDGPQFKMRDDPRVTRVGRWLRNTNVDELPQLINVLLGHMSLVGPRPSPFCENQICVPWRRARLSVRPGITGLWQVCRDENRTQGDFHEWIFYDLTYVRHFSIWLDLRILLATISTLGGRWNVPLSWMLPRVAGVKRVGQFSVSTA